MLPWLELPVRYIKYPEPGEEFDESRIRHEETILKIKIEETALVLVDIWKGPEPLVPAGKSWCNRVKEICEKKIRPSLNAARKVGITIVHAPSSHVAKKYPQWQRLLRELNPPKEGRSEVDWPPKEFVDKLRKEFFELRHGKGSLEFWQRIWDEELIADIVEPLPDEYVISTGDELNEILKRKGILNLVYVGFATNMCLIDKPGAMREMSMRGYNLILLRDCTTAVETCETLSQLLHTKVFVDWIEMTLGYTATSEDFIIACKKALGQEFSE